MRNSVKLAGICPIVAEKVSVLTCTREEESYPVSTRNPFPDDCFRDLTQSVQVNFGTLPHIRVRPLPCLSQFYRTGFTTSLKKQKKNKKKNFLAKFSFKRRIF